MDVTSLDTSGSNVMVDFAIGDNLSKGMIARGAKMDTLAILQAVHESEHAGKSVTITGSFPMVDQYGNTEVDQILLVNYSAETIGKINYDNVLVTDGVWDLAEDSPKRVHPELVTD